MRQAFWLAITFLAIENAVLVNLFITKHIVLTSTLSEGSDLLLVAVDKQSPAKPGKFEIDFEQSAANDQWIENPIAVAHRAFGTTAPVNLWLIQGKGDDSNELFVTAISDRFSDDSVRGKLSELILKRGHDGHWHIDSALESHRCWPGRGHQSFGIEPCS